ncbi:MAG: hypothetical protein K6G08_01650 [Prevotella sp.]|nr:hypothetical protein [Prevotella sp.]
MGFNIKNNYGPNIEVGAGGKVTLVQGRNGLWHTVDAEEEEVVEEIVDIVPDEVKESGDANDDYALVANLMPIFYNNEEDVRRFLKEIRGMAQEDITDVVNRWVDEKRISDYGNSRKGVLWGILNKAGLYTRSKQNWNGRVI